MDASSSVVGSTSYSVVNGTVQLANSRYSDSGSSANDSDGSAEPLVEEVVDIRYRIYQLALVLSKIILIS